MRITLIIPTLNGGTTFAELLASLCRQTMQPDDRILLDSGSSDDTVKLATEAGFIVVPISRGSFDHGGTRQLGVEMTAADVVVLMTQDAILADEDSLERLTGVFADSLVGAAYGRQLPRIDAGPSESHARLFNYPQQSRAVSKKDITRLGLRAAFLSDSFAAYRRKALLDIGGFSRRTIMGEDMIAGAKLLRESWNIVYCADAKVYHSHQYEWHQEFSRYFDTGVMHACEPWLLCEFGGAGGEGLKFVRSELLYLWRSGNAVLTGGAFFRTTAKYLGYQLGRRAKWFPLIWKKRWSLNKGYWEKE